MKASPRNHSKRFREALRPGGLLVIEGFAGKDAPTSVAFETNELLRTYVDLKIVYYEDGELIPNWGRQRVKRRVVRLIAARE